jgi:DNA-binding transcriptional MerR regulator
MTDFTLAELARQAEVSARTVRYYIQRGILRAPEFRGPDTHYDDGHLLALRAIRVLQAAYWPLDAIASALQAKSPEQLRAIAAGQLPPVAAPARPRERASRSVPAPIPAAKRGQRFWLADGLELWLDDSADGAVKRLADSILELAAEQSKPRKRGGDHG